MRTAERWGTFSYVISGLEAGATYTTRLHFAEVYFTVPNQRKFHVTINGQQTPIMDGVITRQEVSVSNEPGQSTLSVTGEDLSVLMDLIDFTGIIRYPAMAREVRVLLILAKYAAFGIIPKIIPSVLMDVPLPTDTIPGHEGTDYAYLNELADTVGYVFYVEPTPVPGVNTAYWGPEIKFGLPQPALTVNSDAHSNIESLSLSFDGMSSTIFIFYVQNNLAVPKIAYPIPLPPITPLNPPLGPKIPPPLKVVKLNRPDEQQEETTGAGGGRDRVRERATARLTPTQAILTALGRVSKSADLITGSGQLDVLRYGRVLQPRQLVLPSQTRPGRTRQNPIRISPVQRLFHPVRG